MKNSLIIFSFLALINNAQAQLVSTLAGSGTNGTLDGLGSAASFKGPYGLAVDASGYVYVADRDNNKIRKISPAGEVSTFAGSGVKGSADGEGSAASFIFPQGVAIDASGYVYVADKGNRKIRKISPSGVVSTLAGTGRLGNTDGVGTSATFFQPIGLTVDAIGNVYVADWEANKIRKISPDGIVSTLAGSGAIGSEDGIGKAAILYEPHYVAVDGIGNVYVPDNNKYIIRKISPSGMVTTFAGSGTSGNKDGTGTAASFGHFTGIAVDNFDNVYVTELGTKNIRKISPNGTVSTLLKAPYTDAFAIDLFGNMYVSDVLYPRIYKITLSVTGLSDDTYVEGGLSVFPNPNNGAFTINISKDETLNLINSLGQTVQTLTLNKGNDNSVNISDIGNGVYTLKSTTNPELNHRVVVTK